jgi:hypothetical protein
VSNHRCLANSRLDARNENIVKEIENGNALKEQMLREIDELTNGPVR